MRSLIDLFSSISNITAIGLSAILKILLSMLEYRQKQRQLAGRAQPVATQRIQIQNTGKTLERIQRGSNHTNDLYIKSLMSIQARISMP